MRLPASSSVQHKLAWPVVAVLLASLMASGCGSAGIVSRSSTPQPNTSVTVLLTSTANDQLSEFDVGFLDITLTSQSGKTVSLLSLTAPGSAVGAEFVHMNGRAEPLVTASLPQDVYTMATATLNGAQFVCLEAGSSDGQAFLDTSTYNDLGMNASAVTVDLPLPITVAGASMALSLDLQVSQSASYSSCYTPGGISSFSITPTFNLVPLTLSSSPTNSVNGKVSGLDGEVSVVGTDGSWTLSLPDAEGARSVSVNADGDTAYQGIANASAVAVGTFIDMDGAIQADGSLLATRIAVEDASAADTLSGPLIEVSPSVSILNMLPRRQQGKDFVCCYQGGSIEVDYSGAAFQVSGQLANLGKLPFVPSFNAANMVPGQNVYVSDAAYSWSVPRPAATTLTLMPQTLNGAVVGSSKIGSFTDYTISLASYDLFPMLAGQPNQTTVENNRGQVEVYVDSNTQLVNLQPLAAGSTLRFYGLVFNDNGTLRMDCAQVNDGVDFTAQPSVSQQKQMEKGSVKTNRDGSDSVQQTVSMIAR